MIQCTVEDGKSRLYIKTKAKKVKCPLGGGQMLESIPGRAFPSCLFTNLQGIMGTWSVLMRSTFATSSSMSSTLINVTSYSLNTYLLLYLEDIDLTNYNYTLDSNSLNTGAGNWSEEDLQPIENANGEPGFNYKKCLNQCYGRGTCFNGKCRCNEGWVGDDCNTVLFLIDT